MLSQLFFAVLLDATYAFEWMGCESFPGFGSATDSVTLDPKVSGGGSFNITTMDFLGSRSCHGAADLTWGHHGAYSCGTAGEVKFERQGVWIEVHTLGGLVFGKVLCPHISFQVGKRVNIPVEDLAAKCSSLTFNNCGTFYDTLSSTADGSVLHRSSTPSCQMNSKRLANGPALHCTGTVCQWACSQPIASPPALGSCGKECSADSDCAGCGGDGRCKGSDNIDRICVDAPSSIPKDPEPQATAVDWPEAWSADMFTLTYNDFSSKSKTQTGRFYYDYKNLRQKQDYGKTALLYMGGASGKPAKFYFIAFGVFCFYVDVTDPLTHEVAPIPRPDFMKVCADAQMGSYVGREKVSDEWADHYNCSVAYDNQTISFQSWHSLGLGATAFGRPLQLSAGDSKPNWQAPRLTTTWYSNVTIGPQPDSLFVAPKVCLPIPQVLAEAHFGSKLTDLNFLDEAIQEKAVKLLLESQDVSLFV